MIMTVSYWTSSGAFTVSAHMACSTLLTLFPVGIIGDSKYFKTLHTAEFAFLQQPAAWVGRYCWNIQYCLVLLSAMTHVPICNMTWLIQEMVNVTAFKPRLKWIASNPREMSSWSSLMWRNHCQSNHSKFYSKIPHCCLLSLFASVLRFG